MSAHGYVGDTPNISGARGPLMTKRELVTLLMRIANELRAAGYNPIVLVQLASMLLIVHGCTVVESRDKAGEPDPTPGLADSYREVIGEIIRVIVDWKHKTPEERREGL